MKRLVLGLMLLTISLTILTSCKFNEEVVIIQKNEISFWYGLEGVLGDYVEILIEDFNRSQDDVIVVGHRQGNYTETFNSLEIAIATNMPPSVALLEQRDIISLIKRDALSVLSDSIVDTEDIPDQFLQMFTQDDYMYSLPMYATVWITYMRNDFIDELEDGKDIYSFQELMKVLSERRKISDDESLVFEIINDDTTLINAVMSNGGEFISSDYKEVLIDKPEWIEVWEEFRKWIHEDELIRYYDKNLGWDNYYEVINDVKSGRAIGCISSVSDMDIFSDEEVTPMLHLGWEEGISAPVTYAIGLVIPRNVDEEDKEAASRWIEYLMSPEVSAKWVKLSGYLPGNLNAYETQLFKEYAESNERINVSRNQLSYTSPPYYDPTGGKINEAIIEAAEKLINDNIPAEIVLNEAKAKAQKELDKIERE
ncbi:extracellular solute-binding protein [Vallitalea okinawensis]|uniref:extracellular solute-binding protein n=1 Tax=Vallitalea okinawensis TaxID=2078660 RepID=UPI000CFD4FD3|nr:extracellular solute-binding protein [Vallitalea okinawensis]